MSSNIILFRSPPFHLALCAASLALGLNSGTAFANEGQWMPEQIHNLDAKMLKRMGLELDPAKLYTAGDQTSLLHAVINLNGCSAAFISEDGLISTNHHCAYRALQAASSVEKDYLASGFFAPTREAEIEGKGLTVKVLQSIADVTKEVRASFSGAPSPTARALAEERKKKELVAACEASGEFRCQVASFYRGSLFQLFAYLELTDIRLVYAPPSALGNFGGEVDNWMWPRHSVDFTLLRAYTGPGGKPASYVDGEKLAASGKNANKAFRPKRWLEVSPDGVSDGSFVATIGYPGHTDRYLSSSEVARQLDQVFPTLIEVYGEWMQIQDDLVTDAKQTGDEGLHLKVAGRQRSLSNRHKNARGMVAGIKRMRLLERRQAEDAALRKLALGQTPADAEVPTTLRAMSDERREQFAQRFLLRTLLRGPDSVAVAVRLLRWARERSKPDLERRPGFQDRDKDRVQRRLSRNLGTYHPVVDEALLRSWLKRARSSGLEFKGINAKNISHGTKLFTGDTSEKLLASATEAELLKSRDPALRFAAQLVPLLENLEAQEDDRRGRELLTGPRYFKLLKSVRKGPVYPDANRTLRFSFASVKGYAPRDGLWASPQTTLAGQLAKETKSKPFLLPANIVDKASSAKDTYWADPHLLDLPVCFLSTSDTTGGNSGSPVIDGKGRLVGFNFDRVWENIAGDFGYNVSRSRNISVDVRYLLWMLDEIVDGTRLLDELKLSRFRDQPRREGRPGTAATNSARHENKLVDDTQAAAMPKQGCGQSPTATSAALLIGLAFVAIRSRKRPRTSSDFRKL